MLTRLFVIAFGFAWGLSAWRNTPPMDARTAEAFGMTFLLALGLAYLAGRRFTVHLDEQKLADAVAAARAEAIAHADSSAAAQSAAVVNLSVASRHEGAQVLDFASHRAAVDDYDAADFLSDGLGVSVPPDYAAEILHDLYDPDHALNRKPSDLPHLDATTRKDDAQRERARADTRTLDDAPGSLGRRNAQHEGTPSD